MYTLSDKNYFEELNHSNPDICSRVKALFESTKDDIRMGCHDILNAVSLIHGYSQLYASSVDDINQNPKWNIVTESIQYLIKLMTDISTYRYADNLKLSFGNLETSLQKAISDYREKSSLNIHLSVSDSLPDIAFNTEAVSYIINALLDNISDINSTATAEVVAKCDNDHIHIIVSDNLGGISDDYMSKLFQPFVNCKELHSGLSLATAYRMMMAHNGSLSYSPSASGGSSFTLSFKIQSSHQTF